MLPQVTELMDKLQSHRQVLVNALEKLTEEQAAYHPGEEWSAKQQVAHLVYEEPWWTQWAAAVRKTPGTVLEGTKEGELDSSHSVEDADSKPWDWWLDQLRETRAKTLRLMQELDLSNQEALEKSGMHQTFGEMNVLQFLRGIYRHDRMHTEQVLGVEQSFVSKNVT